MIKDLTENYPAESSQDVSDRFGRRFDYLRISVTDACNLSCIYCMPEDMVFRPRGDLLLDDEICRLVRVFAKLGFGKFRLTGGEPTVRENIAGLIRRIGKTSGVREVAMTTNGILLRQLAGPLARAGLRRINVRLDTLDPEKFRRMSRRGNLDEVWAGILAAEEAGLDIKINAVVIRGFNDVEDAVELARMSLARAWQIRFLEVMPLGKLSGFQRGSIVSEAELRETITAALGPLAPVETGRLGGAARLYRLQNAAGTIGFISSVTQPFCSACGRARLTADGHLRLCLLRENEVDLRTPLRTGTTNGELEILIRDALRSKPREHDLAHDFVPLNRVMSEIGG
ncbi:MAG: GTP 3',8-cyclase MoaA [bacterium]